MFEIHVEDRTVQTGMVPVSWCVSRALLARLAELGIKDPHVLLVAAPAGDRYHPGKETRKLVPLTDGMGYVEFRTDGPNRVFAVIMFWWGGIRGVDDYLFAREGGVWKTNLLTTDGSALSDRLHKAYYHGDSACGWGITELPEADIPSNDATKGWRAASSTLDVIVPAGVFAKPPPAWETAWVNHWFRNAPIDECDYRKRRLWAYSVQPPVMLVNWLIRLAVTLFALLAGFKQVNWQPVFHLLSTGFEQVVASFENGNYFWPRSWGKNPVGFLARCSLPLFSPLSLLAIAGIASLAEKSPFATVFAKTLIGLALGIPAIVAVAFGIATAIALAGHAAGRYSERKAGRHADYLDPETVDFLACDAQGGTRRTIGNVPWRRRSVRLIFQATKAQVCRPFAR